MKLCPLEVILTSQPFVFVNEILGGGRLFAGATKLR